jgi:hypothetical protein
MKDDWKTDRPGNLVLFSRHVSAFIQLTQKAGFWAQIERRGELEVENEVLFI